MNKILKINIDDIIIDPSGQSDMITNACNHNTKMYVTGLCQSGDSLIIAFEEVETVNDISYVLAPFDSLNADDIISEISIRYFAGFSMLGGFELKSEKWALFSTEKAE